MKEKNRESRPMHIWCLYPKQIRGARRRYFVGVLTKDFDKGMKVVCGQAAVIKTVNIDTEIPEGGWVIKADKVKGKKTCFIPDGEYEELELQWNDWTNSCIPERLLEKSYNQVALSWEYGLSLEKSRKFLAIAESRKSSKKKKLEDEDDE